MNRRHFIYLAGLLSLGISCSALPVLRMKPVLRLKDPAGPDDLPAHIFYLASLAPSSHNTQPWFLQRQSEKSWLLSLDQKRCLPAADPSCREMFLSLGAFMENLLQAAPLYGCDASYSVSSTAPLRLRIGLQPTGSLPDETQSWLLKRRRTLRRNLLPSPLTAAEQSYILGDDRLSTFFPRASTAGQTIAELTQTANQNQSRNPAIQEELSRWIRWQHVDQQRFQDGLSPETMEMDFWLKWLAEYFIQPKDVLSPFFQKSSLEQIETQVKESAGWIICRSSSEQPADLLETGRRMEALWLRAAAHNLALHPMSQALEETGCRQQLEKTLALPNIQFLARIGHCAAYPPPVSLRRPLKNIV